MVGKEPTSINDLVDALIPQPGLLGKVVSLCNSGESGTRTQDGKLTWQDAGLLWQHWCRGSCWL